MKDPGNILEKAIARNEPVFVIRAQDKLSLIALSAYIHAANLMEENAITSENCRELESIYNDFLEWQINNTTKFPD